MSSSLIVAMKEIREHLRDVRSLATGAAYALMGPVVILGVALSDAARAGGPRLLLSMMSVFTLVSAFAGGMHLALDSTAGERERGSFVPLFLNPVGRLQLVAGKWIGVSVFSLVALALNLAGFTLAFEWSGVVMPGELTRVLFLWVVFGLVPLALLGAALEIAAAATCHTVKEAYSRLSFVVFVPMIVGMFLIFFPGWIGSWWFTVPLIGQQALINAGLRGDSVSVAQAAVLAFITVAVAVVAVVSTARSLDRAERVLG